MERWVTKLISLTLIFIITMIATLLPIKVTGFFMKKGRKGVHLISLFMCFGGGVFFAIYMLHMSPDVHEIIHVTLVEPYGIQYPIADLIISFGFFLMVYMETSVHSISSKRRAAVPEPEVEVQMQSDIIGKKLSSHDDVDIHVIKNKHTNNIANAQCNNRKSNTEFSHRQSKENNSYEQTATATKTSNGPAITVESDYDSHSDLTGHNHLQATRSLILLLALSLHHIFEGISVGLKHTNSGVWNLTIAIISHEVVIAFSLGLQLVKTYKNQTSKIVLAAVMCSSMVPIGVVIGIALTETALSAGSGFDIANGVLQGVATGVFIYVTFFEILQGELTEGSVTFSKVFSLTFGFVVLALLGLLPEETEFASSSSYNVTLEQFNSTCNMTINCI